MNKIVTSRHNRSSSELFLMVPIKPGFVPISDVVLTYASRVSAVLNTLFELRQQKLERGHGEQIGPIERMETISRVQWMVLRNFDELRHAVPEVRSDLWTQIRGPQLILTSHFDRSWEDYFHVLVDLGKPLLDLIFSHCEGYEDHSCEQGYEVFSEWIREHQRPVNFLFAASPEITVADQRYFRGLMTHLTQPPVATGAGDTDQCMAKSYRALMSHLATFKILGKEDETEQTLAKAKKDPLPSSNERFLSVVSAVNVLYDIGSRLFSEDVELEGRTGTKLYEAAVRSLLAKEPDVILLERELKALQAQASADPADSAAQPAADHVLPKALAWIKKVLHGDGAPQSEPSPATTTSQVQRDRARIAADTAALVGNNIQVNILERQAETEYGALLLLHCEDRGAFRALFDELRKIEGLWLGRAPRGDGKVFLNFALTYTGLERARLGEDVMRHFPREFREGMEERAGILGDVGPYNHPRFWETPLSLHGGDERIHLAMVDAVIILHADSASDIANFLKDKENLRKAGIHPLHCSKLLRKGKEGFGFRDQISQPIPDPDAPEQHAPKQRDTPKQDMVEHDAPERDRTALGEFLLGYRDRNRRIAPCAEPKHNPDSVALFKDSTFMVMRKMRQELDNFDSYVRDASEKLNAQRATGAVPPGTPSIAPDGIRAAIVGRRPDGGLRDMPDVPPENPAPNDFDFSRDPLGAVCPFHAHIRLANPRLPGTPRILRRGLFYQEKNEKGSLFIAYNASIAEQYEILQRYINGGNPTGISSFQNDPLCGAAGLTAAPRWVSMSGTGNDDFVRLPERPEDKPFVRLRWGLYLFVPSRKAVEWLAQRLHDDPAAASGSDVVARGAHRIRDFDALPEDLARLEWKRVLEEVPEAGTPQASEADEICAAVRSTGGVKKIGRNLTVVASEECAKLVLGDDGSTFSVCAYKERLAPTIEDHYLAHDVKPHPTRRGPTYADLSAIPNELLEQKVTRRAYDEAFVKSEEVLLKPDELQQTLKNPGHSVISIRDLARAAVAGLCEDWFDLPSTPNTAGTYTPLIDSLERFLLASRYAFQFDPGHRLEQDALKYGGTIVASYPGKLTGSFAKELEEAKYPASLSNGAAIRRQAIVGAVVGFAPPTVGAVTRILDQWIENGDFWRIRADAMDTNGTVRQDVLKIAVLAALGQTPSPPILYRTVVKSVRLGSVDLQPGTTVVVSLSSVYADARARGSALPEAWLFGGQHCGAALVPGKSPHGCPVRDAGTEVITGIIAALFMRKNVKRERRFVLSYDSV